MRWSKLEEIWFCLQIFQWNDFIFEKCPT